MANIVDTKYSFAPELIKSIHVAIVSSEYNSITSEVKNHCIETFEKYNVKRSQIAEFSVPGAWEIPVICSKIATSGNYDGVIVYGTMILDTFYLKELIDNCTTALMKISVNQQIPIINEIIIANTMSEAKKRVAINNFEKDNYQTIALLRTLEALQLTVYN